MTGHEAHIAMLRFVRENPDELILTGTIEPVGDEIHYELITRRITVWDNGKPIEVSRIDRTDVVHANLDALMVLWEKHTFNRWDEDDSGAWELEHPTPPDHIIAA